MPKALRSARRKDVWVLVPGAGLGRLAFDIACAGFNSQGNEFSYYMLIGACVGSSRLLASCKPLRLGWMPSPRSDAL
jgi:peptidoglycan/LPS O-acetylase OafA/YrhL